MTVLDDRCPLTRFLGGEATSLHKQTYRVKLFGEQRTFCADRFCQRRNDVCLTKKNVMPRAQGPGPYWALSKGFIRRSYKF